MSELLIDIKNYLIAQSIDITANIYLDNKPDTPDNIIVISEYAGSPGSGRDYDERRIQILVRNTVHTTGKTKINAIRDLLDNTSPEQEIILATTRSAIFSAIQTPFKVSETRKRIEFICNFSVFTERD